ncbi:MAG: hypothetical protein BGO29_00205 [Bacteroidales bacterium 36-12]|nr:MAG: hypothetical protein BGO29_00205 [Bacteroidales bacterium 36-12]
MFTSLNLKIRISQFAIILCILSIFTLPAKAVKEISNLSNQAELSLLIASPHPTKIESFFGHAALRINDPILNIDYVLNYGMFDASTPTLVTISQLLMGNLQCELFAVSFEEFVKIFKDENRRLTEYVLNLSQEEKETIWQSIMYDAQTNNRFYVFDFFNENCTTFPRDIIHKVLNEKLKYPFDTTTTNSYREIAHAQVLNHPWFIFFIDLVFGLNIDKQIPLQYILYVPNELQKAWSNSEVINNDGSKSPFLEIASLINEIDISKTIQDMNRITPIIFAIVLFCIVLLLTIFEFYHKKYFRFIDLVIFGIVGLFGLLFYVIQIGYANWYYMPNWNMLWLHPFYLLIVAFMLSPSLQKLTVYFNIINILAIVFLFGGFFFLPQHLNISILPIMGVLLIRLVTLTINIKKTFN